jgi:hypothetical protein
LLLFVIPDNIVVKVKVTILTFWFCVFYFLTLKRVLDIMVLAGIPTPGGFFTSTSGFKIDALPPAQYGYTRILN